MYLNNWAHAFLFHKNFRCKILQIQILLLFYFSSLLKEDGTPGVYLFRKGSDGVRIFHAENL